MTEPPADPFLNIFLLNKRIEIVENSLFLQCHGNILYCWTSTLKDIASVYLNMEKK